jgi:adenosylcobyric acid synthase
MAALMVQGTSSWAGKSLITTALARAFRRRGIDVVPFKAQNMSNNARVVRGGEIGTAQYLQALAAGVEPDVRMNPVLVKPEGDSRSQVVVLGRPDVALTRLSWRSRGPRLWPVIERSLRSLMAEHQLVLLEGAGSPAETNLRDTDLANMRSAAVAAARVVLVADIDRGGAFAHLYGTWAMVSEADRSRFVGFVLNKFRGDPALLGPAPEELERLTGVPTIGVIPWLEHGLPDEDGAATPPPWPGRPSVAVVRYPTASNLDEFKQLEQVVDLRWIDRPGDVDQPDLVILPGSKHVAADLAWLVSTGIAEAVKRRARAGRPTLGICGGMQMLGQRIENEGGVDGGHEGLGLLPLRTTFVAPKLTEKTSTIFGRLSGPWQPLSGRPVSGYQIRHGQTTATEPIDEAIPGGLGFVRGAVLGIYLHGVFEDADVLAGLFRQRPPRSLDRVFDELADAIEEHLDVPFLLREAGVG